MRVGRGTRANRRTPARDLNQKKLRVGVFFRGF
jgi:hypothetical protein